MCSRSDVDTCTAPPDNNESVNQKMVDNYSFGGVKYSLFFLGAIANLPRPGLARRVALVVGSTPPPLVASCRPVDDISPALGGLPLLLRLGSRSCVGPHTQKDFGSSRPKGKPRAEVHVSGPLAHRCPMAAEGKICTQVICTGYSHSPVRHRPGPGRSNR